MCIRDRIYDELMEGFDGSTRNTVKITPEKMDIHKKGIANADMVFETVSYTHLDVYKRQVLRRAVLSIREASQRSAA